MTMCGARGELPAPIVLAAESKARDGRAIVVGFGGPTNPLGQGEVNIPAFIDALKGGEYQGPLVIERGVGDQAGRLSDVAAGLEHMRECFGS